MRKRWAALEGGGKMKSSFQKLPGLEYVVLCSLSMFFFYVFHPSKLVHFDASRFLLNCIC